MTQQEMEARLDALEQEVTLLRQPKPKEENFSRSASKLCDDYFEQVKRKDQMYVARVVCSKAAHEAFKAKHKLQGVNARRPASYVRSQEDAQEIFELFKKFLEAWQSYVYGEDWREKGETKT